MRAQLRPRRRASRATSASGATTCSAARTQSDVDQRDWSACRRTGRSGGGCSPKSRLQLRWHGQREPVVGRGADHPRERRLHRRRRAAARAARTASTFEFATDLDYVRGAHSWRTGVLIEGGRYRSDDICELPRHLHLREPRRLQRGQAGELLAPHRRPEHARTRRCRRASTCRTTGGSPRSLLVSAGRPLRRAGPRGRRVEPVAAGDGRRGRRSGTAA